MKNKENSNYCKMLPYNLILDYPINMNAAKAIQELDKILAHQRLTYVLYTCGGAQLIFLGYHTRRTEDVDLIIDKIDDQLKAAAILVAKKLDLEEDWLNNKVFPLGKRLGRNWKENAVLLFAGRAVTLMGLDRQHLINAKLHATVDRRGEDYDDLIFLRPSLTELQLAEAYVLNQKKEAETASIFVQHWVKELKRDLGLD
jgi:hypothetical protein